MPWKLRAAVAADKAMAAAGLGFGEVGATRVAQLWDKKDGDRSPPPPPRVCCALNERCSAPLTRACH